MRRLDRLTRDHLLRWSAGSFGVGEAPRRALAHLLRYVRSLSDSDYDRVCELGWVVAADDCDAWGVLREICLRQAESAV